MALAIAINRERTGWLSAGLGVCSCCCIVRPVEWLNQEQWKTCLREEGILRRPRVKWISFYLIATERDLLEIDRFKGITDPVKKFFLCRPGGWWEVFYLPSANGVLLRRPVALEPVSFFGLQPVSHPLPPQVLVMYMKSFSFSVVKFNFSLRKVNFAVKNSLPTKVL